MQRSPVEACGEVAGEAGDVVTCGLEALPPALVALTSEPSRTRKSAFGETALAGTVIEVDAEDDAGLFCCGAGEDFAASRRAKASSTAPVRAFP